MKHLFLAFLAIIFLFIIFLFVSYMFIVKEPYENIEVDIGNVLSDYYYQIIVSILNKNDFNFNYTPQYNNKNNNKYNVFIETFPKHIPFNIELYDELTYHGISIKTLDGVFSTGAWFTYNKSMETVHKIMKPYIHKIFDETFIKLNLKKNVLHPIIHFRCSDTPFERGHNYYFQRYAFFKHALNDIQNHIGNFKDVTLLSCTTHIASIENQTSCNKYSNSLKDALQNYNVHIECNSNVDDFVSMFYAPAVISTISSFSFMSGFFGHGIFIQPNLMANDKEMCEGCDNVYKNYNIPHNRVEDYHDFDKVYELLSEY